VAICTVTGLELIVGAKNQREVAEIEQLLATFETIHLTGPNRKIRIDAPTQIAKLPMARREGMRRTASSPSGRKSVY